MKKIKNLTIEDLKKKGFGFHINKSIIEVSYDSPDDYDDGFCDDYFSIYLQKIENNLLEGENPTIYKINTKIRLKAQAVKQAFKKLKNDVIIYMLNCEQNYYIKFFKKVGFKVIDEFNNQNTGNDLTVMLFKKGTI